LSWDTNGKGLVNKYAGIEFSQLLAATTIVFSLIALAAFSWVSILEKEKTKKNICLSTIETLNLKQKKQNYEYTLHPTYFHR
jgi:hypothetical protein